MVNEEKIFFNAGDCVILRHKKIANAPVMLVVSKETRNVYNKEINSKESMFVGIKCRWFTTDGTLQEAIFSSKDLEHV